MVWEINDMEPGKLGTFGTTIYEDIKRVYSCWVQFYQLYGSQRNPYQYCKVIWVMSTYS